MSIGEYLRNVQNPGWASSAAGGTSINNVVFGPVVGYMQPSALQAFDQPMSYVMSRGRLRFDAIMGKEMMGTFYFEFDSTRWGERIPAGSTAQRQFSGYWGVADRSTLELKNMFITFGMPWIPVPTTVQAGILPLYIRPGVFLATDGPGIVAAFKVEPALIKLMWGKALEGYDWASDDDDLYAIDVNTKIQDLTVGAYALDFHMRSYPTSADGNAIVNSAYYSSNIWWLGLYADGKVGPVNLNFDFVYDYGNVKDRRDITVRAGDVDYRGWALRANLAYPIEKLTVGATIYGSGADQKKTSASGLPGTAAANGGATSSKVTTYIVPAGTEGGVGDSIIFCGNRIDRTNTGNFHAADTYHAAAPFGGLWINKLCGSYMFTPSLRLPSKRCIFETPRKMGTALETL